MALVALADSPAPRDSRSMSLPPGFLDELRNRLTLSDVVVVTDIYPARESPIQGVTGKLVADAVGDGRLVQWIPDRAALARRLIAVVEPGDVVLLLGAGDITLTAEELTRRLTQEAA